ncbi:MAG: ERCC4 domain-containing protein [Thermoproteota archaeon]|nr:ERCC4 domain-containing protein [Thermoproteota archaeon]
MSGTETLVPYLKGRRDDEQPIIIVDSNEASVCPKIVKGLKEHAAKISVQPLEKGDYVISDVCAIERKTVRDFVYTLTRRHLFEQLFTLKEVYPQSILLLEGYLPIVYKFSRIQPASVWGAMFALAKKGVTMIHTTSYKETVDFLYTAARQEQIVEKRVPVVHPVKRTKTLAEAQIFLLASLPHIGHEKAVSLLKSYQTPLNALINIDSWSKDVYGLGPKITKTVKKVLQTPYER